VRVSRRANAQRRPTSVSAAGSLPVQMLYLDVHGPIDHIRGLINVMLFLTRFLANRILPYIIRRRHLLLSVLHVKQHQLGSSINMNSGSIRFVFDTTQREKMGILLHEILQGNYR